MQVNNTVHGTLYKCKGKYRIMISYYNEEGRRKQKSYPTGLTITGNKRRAEQMLDDKLQEFKGQLKGYQSVDGNCTVSEWVQKYIEYKQGKVRDTTILNYNCTFRKNVKPFFDSILMREVTPKVISDFYNVIDNTLSHSSANVVISLLKGAFDYALKQDIIQYNPIRSIRHDNNNIVYHPQHKRHWQPDEVSKVLDAFKDKHIYPMVVFGMYYGLRRGEILGLTWDDVDFNKRIIYIRNTVALVDKGNYVIRNYCKTDSSQRMCTMTDSIYDLLIDVKKSQLDYKLALGDRYIGNSYNLVFTKRDGTMYSPDGFRQSYIYTLDRAGLPRSRIHDLRHTAATLMFANGADVSTVQHALGHSAPSTTMNIYIHNLDNTNSKAADIIDNVIKL